MLPEIAPRRIPTTFATAPLVTGYASESLALDFKQIDWNGHAALAVSGEIVPGDAAHFAEALPKINPSAHGLPIVLLNSGGGSVGEALQISEIFSKMPVHAVIPSGAKCASACASILFIAGKNRIVEEGGLLGQHSCSSAGARSQECNDALSKHAVAHGVSYGSVAAFVTYAEPKDMIWFSRADADCFGLTNYPFARESGFEKSEPCVIETILGRMPKAQAAWRVDFKSDGYRAFLRPVADHKRELELNLFCDEQLPGTLFLTLDIGGASTVIKNAILSATLDAPPLLYQNVPFTVTQADQFYSRVTIQINRRDVSSFLINSNELRFQLQLSPPYQQIAAWTVLSGSRNALLFAANHCMNQRRR